MATGPAASAFIEYSELNSGKAIIRYFDSWHMYKEKNPGSIVEKGIFDSYFADIENIEIMLVREPVKILMFNRLINEIKFEIPHLGKAYITEIERVKAERILGIDFQLMSQNPNKWVKFVDEWVFSPEKKTLFLKEFTRIDENKQT